MLERRLDSIGKISDISNKHVSSAEEQITEEGLKGLSAKMLAPGTLLYLIFASIDAVGILEIPVATYQAMAGLPIKTNSAVKKDGRIACVKKEQTQCLFRPRAYSAKQILRIY